MTDYFELGRILKPQGIKGEVKIEAYTDDVSRFCELEFVFFKDGQAYAKKEIGTVRTDARYAYVKFAGVADRNDAELLRGRYIYIDRGNAAPLPPGSYYIRDLIGMDVTDETGREIGVLQEILQTGSRDVYVVLLKDGGTLMFPSVDGAIEDRDVEARKMRVNSGRIDEVGIYDI